MFKFVNNCCILELINRVIVVLVFVILTDFVKSQDKNLIKGITIDSETHEPIVNVVIKSEASEKTVISDSSGQFKISKSIDVKELKFIHVSYNRIAVAIDTIKLFAQDYLLVFELQKRDNVLNEVIISAKYEMTRPESNVIDYEFIGNKIVLLNYKTPPYRSEIVVMSEQLDTLAKAKLRIEPQFLKKDCLGNIHVFTSDSSYQLVYYNTQVLLSPPYAKATYDQKMGNCTESTDDFVYFLNKKGAVLITNSGFHDFLSKNNALNYNYFGKRVKKNGVLFDAIDERHRKQRNEDAKLEALQPELKKRNSVIFREMILLDEIYAPLFVMRDTVYILDFINDHLNVFHKNVLITKVPVNFHRTKTWKRAMLIDRVEGKIYSKHIEDGKLVLKQISTKDGTVVKKCSLPVNATTKLKLMNGYAYYLLRNNTNFNYVLNRILLR